LSAKQNLAKEMGAAAFVLIDESLFKRYARYYKRKDQSEGETNLSLDVNSNPFYGFLVGNNIGNSLIKEKNGLYYNDIQIDYKNTYESLVSENVAALIPGSEKPNEYIVISAHLDHIGIHHGAVFNGADDDGSGTVAILEIAEAFQKAVQNGDGPKRSILLLHVSAEEKGLLGSQYYTDFDPIVPLKNTVANLNIDMIGRTDPKRKNGKRNYIYLIGSDKLSTELHDISEMVNEKYTAIELDYTFNDENDPNRFYYRSDHYNFAKKNIPIIFYFNGTHEDYHKATDTVDKIQFDLLENRTKLVFYTAWELANRKERVVVDKKFK
jgi:Zn-dependent M28 family amino/carboxypeptidase